ncbi:reverse transcriptase domain-containing protein [Tanacetum coccineum]
MNILTNMQNQNSSGLGSLPSNTVANPRGDVKAITTQSGVAYNGPTIPSTPSPLPKEMERETEVTKDKAQNTSLGSTVHVHPLVVQDLIPKPKVSTKTKHKPSIPYPSRLNDQNLREKANNQMLKFLQIFQRLHFDISFTDALIHMSKFASMFKSLLTLADLGASINLMPLSVWKQLLLPELTLICMTLDVDPRVPLILGRPFLRMARALIDVYDVACEEYAQEVLGFLDSSSSGNPTPSDPIIASSSPSFTPFEGGDFILEEIETFLCTPEELSNLDDDYYDTKGDILYLEKLLNEDPSPNLLPMKNDDLKQVDVTMTKPSTEEPPELELKDLPSYLEYAFLEGTDKLPVIISKELKEEEKAALLKVLKSHKRAIAWKIYDIKGIDPSFCTHKILMEDNFKPAVQHQRRVNPKIHEVIKKEVIKLLNARLIYLISDSLWVSPVHCVPKKGGMTLIKNKENELIPTRLVTGWQVCIDYQKLNDATRKDHFPLPFMDQMLERFAGNEYYFFLDRFSGYFQITIDLKDQEKTTFTCPYGMFSYRRMPFGLCNALGTFQRCMMAIFHDMIEETMEKGEYDIWAMKMEHYLAHTDYPIWEVIQNGNGPVSITTDTQGQIKVLPPRTVEEILARERERKARITLLMALLEDHLAKFHKMTDAKEMWDAIKSRFGGNDESKKMQKYILKQQFEGFSVSNSEGLHKGYDRFQSLLSQLEIHGAGVSTEDANQKFLRSLPSAWSQVSLIMRTKPGVDSLSFDDLYNNLRVFENDVKGSTASSSSTQNVAFVSENTSSTNDDLEQLDEFDLEEMDLKWQVAMISMRMKKFYKKTGRKLQFDAKEPVGFDKTKVECYNCHKTGHFARECRTKRNQDSKRRDAWNSRNKDGRRSGKQEDSKALVTIDGEVREQLGDASIEIQAYTQALKKVEAQLVAHQQGQLLYEEKISQMSTKDKAGLGYGDQMNKSVLSYENEVFQSVFVSRTSDIEDSHVNDRYVEGMHAVPPPMTGIYIPSGPDKEIDDSQFTYGSIPKEIRPVMNNVQRMNHQTKLFQKHVSTNKCLARKVNTVKPIVNNARTKAGFHKSVSPFRKSFNRTTTLRTNFSKQKVNTAEISTKSFIEQSPVAFGEESDSEIDAESAHDYFVLSIWSSYTSTVKSSKANNAEQDANDAAEALRKEFAQDTEDLLIQAGAAKASSTNIVNTASTPVSTASPYGRLSFTDLTNTNQDDSEIPALEEIYNNPTDGIFTNASYDDEGAVADFTNLETIVNLLTWDSYLSDGCKKCLPIRKMMSDVYGLNLPGYVDPKNPEKFDFVSVKTASTPIETQKPLVKDEETSDVDVTPKTSHLNAVKRIFRYLKGKPKLGLWYPRVSSFDLEAYSDSDYAGANLDRKSTTGEYLLLPNCMKASFVIQNQHLDATKKFVMYPRFISVFLSNQLKNVTVPLDHFPIHALSNKVFSFMVKKEKHFSRKVAPLFPNMLVQPTEDEGERSERPSEPQPTPAPPHPSEAYVEPQSNPSPGPSPTIPILDPIPEGSGGNLGSQSSSDKSLSGSEEA